MMCYLLTWHGYFVGIEPNTLVAVQPGQPISTEGLFRIDVPSSQTSFSEFLENTPSVSQNVIVPGVGDVSLRTQELSNVVVFQRNDRYVCARPDGSLVCDQTNIGGWERFVLVSQESFNQLQYILSEDWIVASSRTLVPRGDICIEGGPNLRIGSLTLPLAPNLPFNDQFAPFRFPVHPEGWKFDQIILYRPLICSVASGANSVALLRVSLKSLFQIGKYDGRVLVFTDMPEKEFRREFQELPPWRLMVARLPTKDRVSFLAGKFAILEEKTAYQCSPVVLMDTDVVYNADIRQMFVDVACAGRPSAPLEHFSNLATSPSVGAQLIQRDNGHPSLSHGFNSGTLAVPNLKEFGHVLAIIRRTIQNYLALNGRESLQWVDQEVSNYISYKFAHFDTAQLSRYVRIGWMRDASSLGVLSGLVHFCGIASASRLEPMEQYLDLLIRHYALQSRPNTNVMARSTPPSS